MCTDHGLTRRDFGFMALGFVGLSFVPFSAWGAGHAEALAVTCIDYRLIGEATKFFDDQHLAKNYDQVSLAGAALAGVSPKFPSSNAAFWDQLALSKKLHDVKKLIVLDHRDCGAYKAAFGDQFAADRDHETQQHKSVMEELQAKLVTQYPGFGYEGYLMALDGTVEKII